MAAFTKGDVVIFPYTDMTSRKVRPCLVISDEMRSDLVLCQITSKKVKKDSYSIELKRNETINGTLLIDSYIRTNMIFTADKSEIIKKVCEIDPKKYDEVTKRITELIGGPSAI